ncbi:MAG: carbohydrate ABC transporter permease [Lachnospiraceae bacterium]|nr:carbohydrate ABC transporter permease [Lachnospiraceae bacterium]
MMYRKKKGIVGRIFRVLQFIIVVGLGILLCMPVLILVFGSIVDEIEWSGRIAPLIMDTVEYIEWKWIPDYPTLVNFRDLLFFTPQFFTLFWNSITIVLLILLGQMLVGLPGAWSLAVYNFRGKKVLFSLYVILMILPFQVTMLSKYLVLSKIHLLNTHWAVILPAVFSTFPVFLFYRSFCGISKEVLEAARMDGANEWRIFTQMGLPLARGGIFAALILDFLEGLNMMEEPMAFLNDKSLWPLSLYLPEISIKQAGMACAASVITLIVSFFVFAMFKDYLEMGIISSALNAKSGI